MDRQTKISQLRKNFSTSDFRHLSKVEKAVKLVHDFNVPSSLAAESVNMSRTTLQRATRAVAEEREIGRCGKPRIFNEIENAQLINDLNEFPADTRSHVENYDPW